ncbi:diguanylate cyclase (GGDEF) domain-containing protein [Pseudidiomarina indica]|uniref:Diguanylate cyclase (GGDEF) domain-containing protein n=1 Tax=Pseudidiomarina indica TaxID=1159017 RepID=A0A1G6BHJ0_9GAMM|nr:bifunctional diguanylate cyclase/phosphodiesterase [Pseudidiomarina indica]SDB20063.1 diguanylate cyclase (GGDEF) domain-containing protein [Pseudidiomarina indica]
MRIIQVDQQARSVVNLVLSASLLVAALVILCYRFIETSQLQLYQSFSVSFLVGIAAIGAALLLFDLNSKREWLNLGSRCFALIAIAAAADGLTGGIFDIHDAQIHPALYYAIGITGGWVFLRLKSAWAVRLQSIVAGLAAIATLIIILLHFNYSTPLLARHPSGSLISASLLLILFGALWNLSTAAASELPRVSGLTMLLAIGGLVIATSAGIVLFHHDMTEARSRGEEAAKALAASRSVLGREQMSLLLRVAERWEHYPAGIHDDMMELDIKAIFRDVAYLESLILRRGDKLVWERARAEDYRFREHLLNDAFINEQFDEHRKDAVQMMIGSHPEPDKGALLYVHVPVTFDAQDYENGYWGVFAVLNIPRMLANQVALRSPIFTYTAVSEDLLLDQAGFWVTPETLDYLQNHALFLYQGKMVTEYIIDRPVYSFMYDLTDLQARALLQMLISVAGIIIVLFMALTVERNRELVIQGRQLKFQAEHDALTGLYNRTTIENAIADRFHHKRDLTVLFIDLDGFTLINDSLGLHVGDRLLQVLAQRLTKIVGKIGTLARFGGDEFLFVTVKMHGDAEAVAHLTQEILQAVAQPYRIMHHKIYLTASIGVAHQSAEQHTPLELIQHADMAMHQAKRLGHNHVQIYQDSMSLQLKASAVMRSSLQEAIERNQLTLHYQPIVRCSDSATVGYEALLRWEREPGKFVSPGEFIPLAEMTGQIIPLSEWVFRRACETAVRLQEAESTVKIAVNLSTLHFNRTEFAPFLAQTLAETGCKPEWLELELTESILMDNTDYAVEVLQKLREQKITIAIDDFGTGFSSLSYLKKLPVDKVKIDRSFVAGIRTHRADRVLIGSVIKIAQSLNFEVVAEGIETPQQAEFVSEMGCDYMQGYYFGRPVPFEEL